MVYVEFAGYCNWRTRAFLVKVSIELLTMGSHTVHTADGHRNRVGRIRRDRLITALKRNLHRVAGMVLFRIVAVVMPLYAPERTTT